MIMLSEQMYIHELYKDNCNKFDLAICFRQNTQLMGNNVTRVYSRWRILSVRYAILKQKIVEHQKYILSFR